MDGDADPVEVSGSRLRLGASPILDENVLAHHLALFAGGEDRRFGGKTRAMASLFPDDYYFDCRNMM